MRHIILSDDGVHLAHNAAHRVMAACYFPESPRDQAQGLYITALEQDKFRNVGADHYRPSEIMLAVANLIEKRTTELYSVGFMASAYLGLAKSPYKPSLRRASIIASCSAAYLGKSLGAQALIQGAKTKPNP